MLGLAMVAAVLLAIGSPGVVLGWDDYSFSSNSENDMLTLINQARAANGLPAFNDNGNLRNVARWRSKDMFDRDYFSHNIPNPPGGKVFDELQRRGICYTLAGENIGVNNYPDDVATQTMFNGWMNSPGHRALILGEGFNRIGLGAFKGKGAEYPNHYWTAVFTHACGNGPPPAPKPTKKPRPDPTPKPPKATPKPQPDRPDPAPEPTPEATPEITPSPEDLLPTSGHDAIWLEWLAEEGFDSGIWSTWPEGPPPGTSIDLPDPAATGPPNDGTVPVSDGSTLQVIEPPPSMGLLDTIVGDVVASYLGK